VASRAEISLVIPVARSPVETSRLSERCEFDRERSPPRRDGRCDRLSMRDPSWNASAANRESCAGARTKNRDELRE
jgi:hypothetical protein